MCAMWKTYYTPTSVEETLRLLADYGPEARIIAGGTDLLIELKRGIRHADVLIDISRIGGLDRIHRDDEGIIHIGPTVTHNQAIASSLLVEQGFPLAMACAYVGTPQLRNRGTIIGNLVTASPANDTITALWALDAQITLRSVRGERTLSFSEFYQGVRQTAMAPDEMVTDVQFPAMDGDRRGTFVKLALRRTHAISVVNAAVVLSLHDNVVTQAAIALGSVAPTIIRAPEAEGALLSVPLSEERIAEAGELAAHATACIDDIRAGADYRRNMASLLVQRALTTLHERNERSAFPSNIPMLWGNTRGTFPRLTGKTIHHTHAGLEPIECTINGKNVVVQGASEKTLLEMLRDDLGLTGSKEGCGEGECGACTIWMDGIAVLACLVPAPRVHGTHIVTIEGLSTDGALHPVQEAFLATGAVQCGFCTPGFVMTGANLLKENPAPTRDQILAGLAGNLCRCTGYHKIVQAIEQAAQMMSAEKGASVKGA